MEKVKKIRCEGSYTVGNAFSLGPVAWKQCPNDAYHMIEIKYHGEEKQTLPACRTCFTKCIQDKLEGKIELLEVTGKICPACQKVIPNKKKTKKICYACKQSVE